MLVLFGTSLFLISGKDIDDPGRLLLLLRVDGVPVDLPHYGASGLPSSVLLDVGVRDTVQVEVGCEEVPEIMEADMRQAASFNQLAKGI